MARKATGTVIEHVGKDGEVYRSLRFTAYGKRRYVSLGAVSEAEAEQQLRYTLADVERGVWQPPQTVEPPSEPESIPTFNEFAGQWWSRKERQLRDTTRVDYADRLKKLAAFFRDRRVDEISYNTVEQFVAGMLAESKRRSEALAAWQQRYDAAKTEPARRKLRRERPARPWSPRSVNKCVILLAQILDGWVEQQQAEGKPAYNPARGKRRMVRESHPRRSFLDSAEQIEALLQAAGKMDREARAKQVHRRAMLATLIFAGPRISELCALRWRDVDLASGWLTVRKSKTDAGVRKVKIRAVLRDELTRIKPAGADPDGYVFGSAQGARANPSNIRNRVLAPAVKAASAALVAAGATPLPEHVTPHSLRRTFASILCAIGEPPTVTMAEMGHTSPNLTLSVYAQAMRRDEHETRRLRALVDGTDEPRELADIGIREADELPVADRSRAA
jgi:integrase